MGIRSVLVILTLAALAAAPRAAAQCAGFSDVSFAQPFCGHVTWLKNRQVTLGCTSASLFCPTDPVTRLSMAVFMNRLGEVASPRTFGIEDSGGALDLSSNNILCVTNIPPRPYARNVFLDAALSYDVSIPAGVVINLFKSVNGAPFNAFTGGSSNQAVAQPNRRNHHPVTAWGRTTGLTIGPNEVHQYAFSVRSGTPQATISAWTCHFQALVLQKLEL